MNKIGGKEAMKILEERYQHHFAGKEMEFCTLEKDRNVIAVDDETKIENTDDCEIENTIETAKVIKNLKLGI